MLDYVIVHELAHLRAPRHDARFWALVGRYPRTERARGFLIARGLEHGLDDEPEAPAPAGDEKGTAPGVVAPTRSRATTFGRQDGDPGWSLASRTSMDPRPACRVSSGDRGRPAAGRPGRPGRGHAGGAPPSSATRVVSGDAGRSGW